MNWVITRKIQEFLNSKFDLTIKLDSSKTSDYLSFDIDGFSHSIRISDHDALTCRSACALVSINVSEIKIEEWAGKFEASLDYDETGIIEWGAEKEFETKEEAEVNNLNAVLSEVSYVVNNMIKQK